MTYRHLTLGVVLAGTTLMAVGCAPPPTASNGSSGPSKQESPSEVKKSPFVLGNLLEPFKPPTLEELNAKAQWVDQPVVDSLEALGNRQKGEKPLTTVAEALKLENKSREDNQKILIAMGRLPDTDQQVNWDAPIYRHSTADVKSTNPIMGSSVIEFDVTGLTGFGLFSFDWDFNPFAVKEAVVSWQTSKDRLYDKVVMRDDLTWSDGQPITAHDVVFSFKVIMSDQVPVPAVRSGTDKLRWVEAYDDHTLVFFHKESLATNLWNLNFPVIPKHVYEKSIQDDPTLASSPYHVQQENHPVSGGAYTITSRTRGQEIVLERRESWYMHQGKQVRTKPYFKTIRWRIMEDPSVALLALKKGDVEEMILNPEQWTTQTTSADFYDKNTKAYGVEWTSFHFCWNLKTPFFSDARVRKAMSWAFDDKEMLNHLLYGLYEPSRGIFFPGSRWAPDPLPAPYHQDLDQAEKLLDEAGWTDHDGDGIRDKTIDGRRVNFEFSLLTANIPLAVSIGNLLKENLDRIGVVCNVRPLEFTVLQDNEQNHKFEAAFGGWGTGTDPDTTENIFGTAQGRNFGQYSNPEIDRLYEEGRKQFDPQKRAEIYRKIHTILWEDQPYTWLYTRNAFYGFNKQLRGYNFSPRGPYNYGPGFSSIWKPAE